MRNNPRAARPASSHAARWEPSRITDLDPQPIQQVAGKPLPANARSVAPLSFWANPHATSAHRAAAVCAYAVWVAGRPDLLGALRELTGRDLACPCPLDQHCHRDVLLDLANPPHDPFAAGGRAMALTVGRPWASLLLVPAQLGGKTVENRAWSTDYRGPVAIYASTRIDAPGCAAAAAAAAGLDADWHAAQSGWLGAAALVDVHRARGRCCAPWGYPAHRDTPRYHWVFDSPQRLAVRTFGRGFRGLRPVSWSVLVRRSLLRPTREPHRARGAP
jgi:hypothetical protein